jgi:hypothetical protein
MATYHANFNIANFVNCHRFNAAVEAVGNLDIPALSHTLELINMHIENLLTSTDDEDHNEDCSSNCLDEVFSDLQREPKALTDKSLAPGRGDRHDKPSEYPGDPPDKNLPTKDKYSVREDIESGFGPNPGSMEVDWSTVARRREFLQAENGDKLDFQHTNVKPSQKEDKWNASNYFEFKTSEFTLSGSIGQNLKLTGSDGKEIELALGKINNLKVGTKSPCVTYDKGVLKLSYPNGDEITIDDRGVKSIVRTVDGKKLTVNRSDLPQPQTRQHIRQ